MSDCLRGATARTQQAIIVRLREDRDDEALFELFNEDCFRHGASHLHPLPALEDLRVWLAGLGDNRFETVAEICGHVVGVCGLYIHPQRRSHSAWVFLGVRKRHQTNGIGKRLLRTAITAADVLFGLGRLELTVFADNEKAISLYRKFGFEIEGLHRNFVHRGDERVDAYSMARLRAEAGPPNSVEELQERIRELACWLRPSLAE